MEQDAIFSSPIGSLYLTAEEDFLTGIYFRAPNDFIPSSPSPVLLEAQSWLTAYFGGKRPDPAAVPVRLKGTAFQQKIWRILKEIPYGQIMSYGQIARRFDGPMSAQAVGGAVGRNPISILIPCHRVLGAARQLTGFDGGLDKKRWLLDHEGILYRES